MRYSNILRLIIFLKAFFIVYIFGVVSTSKGADLPDLSVEPILFSHTENITTTSKTYTIPIPAEDYSNENVTISGVISGGKLWSEHNGDRSNIQGIMNHIFKPGMSEREQAIEAWRFVENETLGHGNPADFFLAPSNFECQGVADGVVNFWIALGRNYRHYSTGNPSMPTGGSHYTAELFWDGKYHIVDANQNIWFPTPWGELAGFEDLVADNSLYEWQEKGSYGFYKPSNPNPNFDYTTNTNKDPNKIKDIPEYTIELRPGEYITRRWWTHGEPRWGNRNFNPKSVYETMYPDNGWTVSDISVVPDFANPPSNIKLTNVQVVGSGSSAVLKPKDTNLAATIEVTLSNPFIEGQISEFYYSHYLWLLENWISGIFESTGVGGEIRVYARDYKNYPESTYTDLGIVTLKPGLQKKVKSQSMTRLVDGSSSRYYFNRIPQFKIVMNGNVRITNLDFLAQFPFNSRALPELRAGTVNKIYFEAGSLGLGGATITHRYRKNTLKFSANPTTRGKPLTLTAKVTNYGNKVATNVVVDFKMGPIEKTNYNMWDLESIGLKTIASILPGETREVSLDWDITSIPSYIPTASIGSHFASIFVDPNNNIAESNENNNETGRILCIMEDPNLMTLAKYIAYGNGILWTWVTYPATGLESNEMEAVSVEVEFRNGGPQGTLLGTKTIPVMTHSEVVLMAIPVETPPSGNVTVIVDPQNKILELDETDNVATGPVRNQAPPSWVSGVPPDSTPPTIPQNLNALPISGFEIDLIWEVSNDPESGISNYKIYRNGINIGQSTSTSFSDKGLNANNTYTYEVSAVNGAGLESAKSILVSVTTLADTNPPDTTPPTLPQNIVAIAQSESTINLTWEVSNDPESGISNYEIYRNGINIGQSTSTSFSDKGLNANNTYTYEVSAVNGAGLESLKSDLVSVTTLGDTIPPTLVSASISSNPAEVIIVFSEPVELTSATNTSNYSINNGIKVSVASLGPDLKTVILTTSPHTVSGSYVLAVNNIKDRANNPNMIAGNTQIIYTFSSDPPIADFTTGQLRSYSTIRSIGLEWDITGDSNHNAVATVQYKEQGTSIWKQAMPLFRVDYKGFNMLAGSILFLKPGTTYEIQIDLTDPDGGYKNQNITIATRTIPTLPTGGRTFYVVPGSGGGDGSQNNPFKGIGIAQSVAQPGDIFLIAAGNYGGRVVFSKAGSIGKHIVWKAVGNGTVTLNGVDLNASYIWLEGLNIERGPSDTTGIKTSNSPEEVVISRNKFNNCHYSIWLSGGGKNWYITDNVIVGDVPHGSGSIEGEGIELNKTSGHVVAYNSISNVADGISYPRTNVDIYGNDIFNTSDDGIEPDYGYANNRIWGNRISNALQNGISFQPMNSAPWYIIRNQVIAGYNALKLRSTDDRVLLANNTFVGWSRVQTINVEQLLGMYSNNNLWISATGDYLWENGNGGSPDWRTNLDYDGFNDLNGGGNKFKWGANQYSSLAAFKAGTGLELNGVSVDKNTCFETFNVNQPPTPSPPQYMTLNAGSNAIDAGMVLPNINDEFSGSAPDLGAYEYGNPLPHYGPRVEIPQDETPPSIPQSLNATALDDLRINLTWQVANDPESGISNYKIYRDGVNVGQSNSTSFSDTGLGESITYTYEVSAVNGAGLESLKSSSVLVTTLGDTIPPTLVSASISSNPAEVIVVFSEPIEFSSATNTSNYIINNGIIISGASLSSDLKTVTLTTSPHTGSVSYTLTVNNIKDGASIPNVIASNTQTVYTFLSQLIISNLTVASGKTYEVVQNGLQNGGLVYIDRTYTFSTVPTLVKDATYIKTANDDKNASGASFITFYTNQDVTVYVAYDDRITKKPLWLTSFTDTGDNLVTTDATLSIFAKDYAAGTITLGGNEAGYSMYTLIIRGKGTGSVSDINPPVISNSSPSGTLSSGTSVVTLSLSTDEPATCRYSNISGISYSAMTNTFSNTGSTSHSTTLTGFQDGKTYNYYIRCQDSAGNANTNDYTISFTVGTPPIDTTPPDSPTGIRVKILPDGG